MSKTRDLTAGEKKLMGDAAALIRTHLWLGNAPPPSPFPNDPRRWSMARELSVWKRIVFCGADPEELNGAIQHIRDIIHQPDEPLRLTTIYNSAGYATPVYEQARAAWINAQDVVPYGGKTKVPPAIRDILRGMRDG